MNAHNKLVFASKNKYKLKKIKIISAIFCLICCAYILISIYSYKSFLNNFKNDFNNNEFASANSILLTKQNLNPIKKIYYKKDLSQFFNDEISNLQTKLENKEITYTEALNIISEIKHYDFVNCDISSITSLAGNGCFSKALELYNQSNFTEAYYIFAAVPYYSTDFDSAQNYMSECKDKIKNQLLDEVDILCKNNYYSKALDALYETYDIIGTDHDIIAKKEQIESSRSDFIAMQKTSSGESDSTETNASSINTLNASTINNLSISSFSSFLVNVNLTDQKTYIYSGATNKWSLIKTMNCSTGIESEKTPEGTFTIKEKGHWFFSEKYQEGGKFWCQFEGNYLFHSVPYDKSQKKVLDYTLGTPASHGCIRLSESDAKWLYDNVPSGSKVIINN